MADMTEQPQQQNDAPAHEEGHADAPAALEEGHADAPAAHDEGHADAPAAHDEGHADAPAHHDAPAHEGDAPAHEGDAPAAHEEGHADAPAHHDAPVHEGDAPVHEGDAPAHEGNAPAHEGNAPAHEGDAPAAHEEGQADAHDATAAHEEGHADAPTHHDAPAHEGDAPVHEGDAPAAHEEGQADAHDATAAHDEGNADPQAHEEGHTDAPAAHEEGHADAPAHHDAPAHEGDAPVHEGDAPAHEGDAPAAHEEGHADAPAAHEEGHADAPAAHEEGNNDAPAAHEEGHADAPAAHEEGHADAPAAHEEGNTDAPVAHEEGHADAPAHHDAPAHEEPAEPPRPVTPERNRDLRAAVAEAKQRRAEKQAAAESAAAALAARRSREQIQADIDATDAATREAEDDISNMTQRQGAAKTVLALARSLAARVKRLENYIHRIAQWTETDFKTNAEAEVASSKNKLDEELLTLIRALKKRREDEAMRVNAMIVEHRENNKLLCGTPADAHADPNTDSSPTPQSNAMRHGNSPSQSEPPTQTRRAAAEKPTAAQLAAWDLEEFQSLNDDARLELSRARKVKEDNKRIRAELSKSLHHTKRMIEREIQALTFKQAELSHALQARRKRVLDMETENSSLASSLQYAHQTLKMVWTKPVEECLIAQKGTVPRAIKENPNASHTTPVKTTSNHATNGGSGSSTKKPTSATRQH